MRGRERRKGKRQVFRETRGRRREQEGCSGSHLSLRVWLRVHVSVSVCMVRSTYLSLLISACLSFARSLLTCASAVSFSRAPSLLLSCFLSSPSRSLLHNASLPIPLCSISLTVAPSDSFSPISNFIIYYERPPYQTVGPSPCLYSAPGYFIRRGAPGSRQWVVHAEGGGWCWTADQCLARSTSSLGTSTVW